MSVIVFRHGHSLANQESRIVSSVENGTKTTGGPEGTGFGLSQKGRVEVAESSRRLATFILSSLEPNQKAAIKILTSPFQRTRQTAAILASELEDAFKSVTQSRGQETKKATVRAPVVAEDLRERFFGDFEMQQPSDDLYAAVWAEDAKDPTHTKYGVESVNAVIARMTAAVRQEESQEDLWVQQESDQANGRLSLWLILVSHGDSLQILQTAMLGWTGDRHRAMEHLDTASWRQVEWQATQE